MRFLLAAFVAVVLLGSVALCQFGLMQTIEVQFVRDVHTERDGEGDDHAGDRFTLVVTPSFSAMADPFAVVVQDEAPARKITIRAGDQVLFQWDGDVTPGVAIRREGVAIVGLRVEWFVEATPAFSDAARPCALRIQVYQGDVLYGDKTLWSEGDGSSIAERLVLDLAPDRNALDRGLTEGAT